MNLLTQLNPYTRWIKLAFYVFTALALVSMVAVLVGKPAFVTFDQWWMAGSTVLTLFGAAHVADTHMQQKKNIPAEQQTS